MEQKPPLIYTIERSGTNFISHCFNYFFHHPINTHDKNRKGTVGEEINYKDYKVFATIREPKEIIVSELYRVFEVKKPPIFDEKSLIYKADELLLKQEIYFNDLIEHDDFYIMPFKYFTTDIKTFCLKLAKENNFSQKQIDMMEIEKEFFDNPLPSILKSTKTSKTRYPRDYDKDIRQKVIDLCEKLESNGYFDKVNKLYYVLENRYISGQNTN